MSSSQLTNSMIFQRGRLKPPTRLKMLFIFLIYDISHSSVRGVIRTLICSRMCHFVLAGPCELQLHTCKEFDQIPFSKCLKPGFWAILFWYMHALLINVFSSKGFFVQLSTSSLKQVFLLDPPPLPLLRILHQQRVWPLAFASPSLLGQHKQLDVTCNICPNSSHIPWRNM